MRGEDKERSDASTSTAVLQICILLQNEGTKEYNTNAFVLFDEFTCTSMGNGLFGLYNTHCTEFENANSIR